MNQLDEHKQMVKVRDYLLNSYGNYGIQDKDIGWDGQNVTLRGDVLFKPDVVKEGRSWMDQGSVDSTMNTFLSQRGMKPQGFEASQYSFPYADQIKSMFDQIMNEPKFDPNSIYDTPAYSALESKYQRLGDQAMSNTMSEASSMTGGRLNSWATSAGAQAKHSYDQQFTDMIPQLQSNARSDYDAEMRQRMNILDMLQGLDAENYDRWSDARDFNYGEAQDQKNWDYKTGRDALEDERYETEWDYGVSQDQSDEVWKQKEWDHKLKQDELDRQLDYARLENGKKVEDKVGSGPSVSEIFTLAKNEMLKQEDPWRWIEQNFALLRQSMGPDVIMKLKELIPAYKMNYSYSGNAGKENFKSKQLE